MKKFERIYLVLCLVLSGCATQGQPQPIPSLGELERPKVCELTPCPLPGRDTPVINEQLTAALDDAEDALLSCAVQVRDCIQKQDAAASVTRNEVEK